MNIFKKLTLIMSIATCTQSIHTIKSNKNVLHCVHPIAQKCNKNNAKLQKLIKHYNIKPLKLLEESIADTPQTPEQPSMFVIRVLPLWLIVKKLSHGSLFSITVIESE